MNNLQDYISLYQNYETSHIEPENYNSNKILIDKKIELIVQEVMRRAQAVVNVQPRVSMSHLKKEEFFAFVTLDKDKTIQIPTINLINQTNSLEKWMLDQVICKVEEAEPSLSRIQSIAASLFFGINEIKKQSLTLFQEPVMNPLEFHSQNTIKSLQDLMKRPFDLSNNEAKNDLNLIAEQQRLMFLKLEEMKKRFL
jgi:hypothetical protein